MIKLTFTVNGEPITHELGDGHYIIGRSKSCDVVIREPSISGQHVRLDVENDQATFRDLLSRNGTKVNGVKKTSGQLRNGEILRLGHVDVSYFSDAPAPAPQEELAPPPAPAPAGDDDFAAPPPMDPTPGEAMPVVQYQSSGALSPYAPESPTEGPTVAAPAEPSRRPILYAIAGVILVAVFGLVAVGSLKDSGKKTPKKNALNADEKYWRDTKAAAELFTQSRFAEAIANWKGAEAAYRKGSTMDSTNVAATFANIAAPFAAPETAMAAKWSEHVRQLTNMIENNQSPSDLEPFIQTLSKLCIEESVYQQTMEEAAKLRADHHWEEAENKYKEIPATSVYHARMQAQKKAMYAERMKALLEDSYAAAKAADYEKAITLGREYLARSGTDPQIKRDLEKWATEKEMAEKLAEVQASANDADTVAKISEALRKLTTFKQKFPDSRHGQELSTTEAHLKEKQYVIELKQFYHSADSANVEKQLKEVRYSDNAEVRSLHQRWLKVREDMDAGDAEEKKGNFEAAIAAWGNVLIAEPNAENGYHRQAKGKIDKYPNDVLGKKFLDRSVEAFNAKQYARARKLLAKAATFGQDVAPQLKKMRDTGVKLFNQGISQFNQNLYSEAHELINDAMDCFLPSDDFYPRIERWMTVNNIARRK